MTPQAPRPEDAHTLEILADANYFRMVRLGRWEFMQPKKFNDVVLIVPVTDAGEVVLIEQYRAPIGAMVVELPAGLVGDEDEFRHEPIDQAARRELLEETGYEAREMTLLTRGAPSPGSNSVVLTVFLATGLERHHDGGGDATEEIHVCSIPREDVLSHVRQRQEQGAVVDLKVFAGLYLANQALP